jgi:hypothetical protein
MLITSLLFKQADASTNQQLFPSYNHMFQLVLFRMEDHTLSLINGYVVDGQFHFTHNLNAISEDG